MKTLIIYPDSTVNEDAVFYLIDPETGKMLDYHLCSNSGWAKLDLFDNNHKLQVQLKEKYGDDIDVKFINETSYNINDILNKYNRYE